jgi:hypothetical protein
MIVDWIDCDNAKNYWLQKAFLYSFSLVNLPLDSTFVTADVKFMIS